MILTLDYLNLITSEHRDKPKYIQMLTDVFDPYQDCSIALDNISSLLVLDTAEGKELDLIGEYLGQPRLLNFELATGSAYLDDDDYRYLLKAKLIQNKWDGTIEGLYDLWNSLFPDISIVVYDNQDMTANIVFYGQLSATIYQLLQMDLFLPKPAGVKYTYSALSRVTFAYDLDTSLYKGYNEGYWLGKYKIFSFDVDNNSSDILAGFDVGVWNA